VKRPLQVSQAEVFREHLGSLVVSSSFKQSEFALETEVSFTHVHAFVTLHYAIGFVFKNAAIVPSAKPLKSVSPALSSSIVLMFNA
jgi:hypothetical protein